MMKTVGIIGGMGPEATVDLYKKIIEETPAEKDQEHLHVVIDSVPQIPDRTAAIEGEAPSPVPLLQRTARNLQGAGADFLIMPCNTAHYFKEEIRQAVRIPLLDMMEITAEEIEKRGHKKVGLLATTGTLKTRLYHDPLLERGIEVEEPEPDEQRRVMAAIYSPWGIKAGHIEKPRRELHEIADALVAREVDSIIAGCTEIPLAMRAENAECRIWDATGLLARRAVEEALCREQD